MFTDQERYELWRHAHGFDRYGAADESWENFPSEEHVTNDDLNDLMMHTRTMADFHRRSNRGAADFYTMGPDEQTEHFNNHIIPVWQKHDLPIKGKGKWLNFQDEVLNNWRGAPHQASRWYTASWDGRHAHGFDRYAAESSDDPVLLHRGIVFPSGSTFNDKDIQNAVGNHWSADPAVAESFADPVHYAESYGDPDEYDTWANGTGAVVSAWHDPRDGGVNTDNQVVTGGPQYHYEDETTLHSGTPLSVESIRHRPAHAPEWADVPGVKGRKIQASRWCTADLRSRLDEEDDKHEAAQIKDIVPSDLNWLEPDSPFKEPDDVPNEPVDYGEHNDEPSGKWFHVSPHKLQPGTRLTPGGGSGLHDTVPGDWGKESPFRNRRNHLWLAPNMEKAKFWRSQLGGGHVYEVKPGDKPQRWNYTGSEGWVAPHAHVVKEVPLTRQERRHPSSPDWQQSVDETYASGRPGRYNLGSRWFTADLQSRLDEEDDAWAEYHGQDLGDDYDEPYHPTPEEQELLADDDNEIPEDPDVEAEARQDALNSGHGSAEDDAHDELADEANKRWSTYAELIPPKDHGSQGARPPMTMEEFNTTTQNGIMARHAADGRPIGHLMWSPKGEIASVNTHPDFQGRGVANAMLYHARDNPHIYHDDDGWTHPIHHSDILTPHGAAWAASDPHHTMKRSFTQADIQHGQGTRKPYSNYLGAGMEYIPADQRYTGQTEDFMKANQHIKAGPKVYGQRKPPPRQYVPPGFGHLGEHMGPAATTINWGSDA